jgi:hypothetical protein
MEKFDLNGYINKNKFKLNLNKKPITAPKSIQPLKEVKIVNGKFSLEKSINESVKALAQKEAYDRKLAMEVKKHFLEIISTYKTYQEQMNRQSDIVEIAETLGGIVEAAKEMTLRESDDWFDKVTIKRNMQELEKLGSSFDKVATEAKAMDERLHSLYEDMGHILNRYYEIADIPSDVMKERLGNRSIKEAKKYDIGSGWMGNGLTIWNRAEEQYGDYKIIAHIDDNGVLSIRDKQLPSDIKKMFQIWADSMKKGNKGPKY